MSQQLTLTGSCSIKSNLCAAAAVRGAEQSVSLRGAEIFTRKKKNYPLLLLFINYSATPYYLTAPPLIKSYRSLGLNFTHYNSNKEH